ncbi:LysR substrate-binding domain-containing protein [Tsuneonella dongtanensis]|nr:LysR substrate-binding domain-containing protein [Tsuneonella dongtanensis]
MAIETQYLRKEQDNSSVRVSALPMFGIAWLLPRMPDFWARHPTINVALTYSPPNVREFPDHDLWIGFEEDSNVPTRGRAPLMNGATVPVCSPLYLDRKGPILQPSDLTGHDLLHEESYDPWNAWFSANGIEPELAERGRVLTDGNLLLASVLAGDGVALVHKAIISRHLKSHTLVQLFDCQVEEKFGYFLSWDPEVTLRRSVLTFRDWLLECANEAIG